MKPLKAPFPYFGGKSAVAAEVWRRFGNVKNYVEPFFGSGAVLLGRPHWRPDGPRLVETVNDADGLLANFWRAMTQDPEAVARHADWPVNEVDLHARHLWLVGQRERITERLMGDPEWCDAKAAGWWVWGACGWIGSGWCGTRQPRQMPHVGGSGRGVHSARGAERVMALAARLRHVRVVCGDWARLTGAAIRPGMCAVFLDPPYGEGFDGAYASTDGLAHDRAIADDVWAWACEHGDDPALRVCVAGYDDGREVPEGWAVAEWKAAGGYGSQANGDGRANAKRERLWFSPHCLKADEGQLGLL